MQAIAHPQLIIHGELKVQAVAYCRAIRIITGSVYRLKPKNSVVVYPTGKADLVFQLNAVFLCRCSISQSKNTKQQYVDISLFHFKNSKEQKSDQFTNYYLNIFLKPNGMLCKIVCRLVVLRSQNASYKPATASNKT